MCPRLKKKKRFIMFNCIGIHIYQARNFRVTFIFLFPHPLDNWTSSPLISISETLLLFWLMSLFPHNLDSHLFPAFAQQSLFIFFKAEHFDICCWKHCPRGNRRQQKKKKSFNIMPEKVIFHQRKYHVSSVLIKFLWKCLK